MDYFTKYSKFLKKHADVKRPLKIVCDASDGMAGLVLEKLAGIPNMELILVNAEPNPEFPAHGPNPLIVGATDMLTEKVLEVGADFGVVFDADGDRAFFVDDQGKLLASYTTATIWFSDSKPPFVADELTYLPLVTSGLFSEKDLLPSRVGTVNIKAAMKKNNATLGAELSGHFYFRDFFGLDSGIFAMIYMANVLSRQNKTLAEFHADFSKQTLVNTNISLKKSAWSEILAAVKKETLPITQKTFEREGLTLITEDGWINIRTSNTEPLVRVTAGAASLEIAEHNLALITKIVQNTDGGIS